MEVGSLPSSLGSRGFLFGRFGFPWGGWGVGGGRLQLPASRFPQVFFPFLSGLLTDP